jgi:chromosomal replication initiation ATPase DnaA
MDSLDEEIVFVVKRLAKAVSKHGVKRVVAVLDKLNSEEEFIELHKSLIKYIIERTSKEFQVSIDDLKRKNIRGIKVSARNMCFVLIKKHVDMKHEDISSMFGSKSHAVVSNAIKSFENLSYEIKQDRVVIDIFRRVDKEIQERKEMLWAKHS